MQLVEQHVIDKNDSRYEVIDRVAFASKNLYNATLYEMRQAYIHSEHRIFYSELYHLMKSHEAYKALPASKCLSEKRVIRAKPVFWTWTPCQTRIVQE